MKVSASAERKAVRIGGFGTQDLEIESASETECAVTFALAWNGSNTMAVYSAVLPKSSTLPFTLDLAVADFGWCDEASYPATITVEAA